MDDRILNDLKMVLEPLDGIGQVGSVVADDFLFEVVAEEGEGEKVEGQKQRGKTDKAA
jgi:hypothetical protein